MKIGQLFLSHEKKKKMGLIVAFNKEKEEESGLSCLYSRKTEEIDVGKNAMMTSRTTYKYKIITLVLKNKYQMYKHVYVPSEQISTSQFHYASVTVAFKSKFCCRPTDVSAAFLV